MSVSTIPGFSHVEIRIRGKDDLLAASGELKNLAGELAFLAGQKHSDETAVILAHHKIKAASRKLRQGESA